MSTTRTFNVAWQNATKSENATSKFITTLSIDVAKKSGDVTVKSRKFYVIGEDTERAKGDAIEFDISLFDVEVRDNSYVNDSGEQVTRQEKWIVPKV